MTTRIGINGFGRMGRAVYRIIDERDLDLEVVAVNELGPAATMASLLARDSVHGRFAPPITVGEGGLRIGERWVRTFAERDPAEPLRISRGQRCRSLDQRIQNLAELRIRHRVSLERVSVPEIR